MLRRLKRLGLRKIPVGALRLCGILSPPQFCNPAKPSVSLIRVAKSSYTAGRYATLGLNFWKIMKSDFADT